MQASNDTVTTSPLVDPSDYEAVMHIDVTYDVGEKRAEFAPSSSKPWLLGQDLKLRGGMTLRWKPHWRQAHLYFELARHLGLKGCRLDVDGEATALATARPELQLSFPTMGERQGVLITVGRPQALPFSFDYVLHLEHDGQPVEHDPKIYNEGDGQPPD